MNPMQTDNYRSVRRLGRFLFWYGLAVAVLLFFLPWAGEALQNRYEGMSTAARLLSAAGFFAVAGVWQWMILRRRPGALRLRRRNGAVKM